MTVRSKDCGVLSNVPSGAGEVGETGVLGNWQWEA